MGEKFWVKSHNFSQGQRDLREWSLLIGWDEWSHDFGVRFDWNAHHGVVCTTSCACTRWHGVHATWCGVHAHNGVVCMHTMWCACTRQRGVHAHNMVCMHMMAWCAHTQHGVHSHNGVVCTWWCGVHAHDSMVCMHTKWCAHTWWRGVHAHKCGVCAHDGMVCTHMTAWCACTRWHGVHAHDMVCMQMKENSSAWSQLALFFKLDMHN